MSELMVLTDFEHTLERYHQVIGELANGNAGPTKTMFSRREDVTMVSPFGGVTRGKKSVQETIEVVASLYRQGRVTSFDNVAKFVTRNLAYTVEIEHYEAVPAGKKEISTFVLGVTSIFRRETQGWKLVHRHADPITSELPKELVP
jgi:ketosteroid isomerase-like protein